MLGLSIEHLLILSIAALFILGPERLPSAAAWLGRTIRQVSEYTTSAQEQLRSQLGPEFDELRQPLQDLRHLRDFDSRSAMTRYLINDDLGYGDSNVTSITSTHTNQESAPVAHPPHELPPFDPDAT